MKDFPATRQEQFMKLYEPAHARLARYVQTIVWNKEDASDIISETVLKAYESFDKIRNTDSFTFYLFTIARRLSFKMEKRKRWWGLYDHAASENLADHAVNPAARIEMNEFNSALDRLPSKQKEAIVLFEISGFSLAEIRELQGGTLSGVKSRLVRAREELAKMLEYKQKPSAPANNKINNDESVFI